MIRILGVAILAGWVSVAGGAAAQTFEPSGNMTWPQTPEIGDSAAPVAPRRGPSRSPADAWPGTDVPDSLAPPSNSSSSGNRTATPPQAAQPANAAGTPATAQPNQGAQRGPAQAARDTTPPEPNYTPAAQLSAAEPNGVMPPLPHRNLAPAMKARNEMAAATPAAAVPQATPEPAAAEQPASPRPSATAAQPEPAPAEPVATLPATASPAMEPAAVAATPPVDPVETRQAPAQETAVVAPPSPAPTEPQQLAPPAEQTPVPAPPSAAAEIAAAPPIVPESVPTQPAPVEPPVTAALSTPAAEPQATAAAPAEPAAPAQPTPSDAPITEAQQTAPSPAAADAPAEAPAAPASTPSVAAAPNEPAPQAKVDDGLMTLIGQMIVTGFAGTEPNDPGVKAVIEQLRKGRIGGVVVAEHNILATRQLKALAAALRDAGGNNLPLLIVAHEGGSGQAMTPEKGFSAYPSAAALGRSDDPLNAFNVYRYMAEELAAYGFNVNLGPVIDLDPASKIDEAAVEGRSYGVVPKHVAAFAKAFRLAHHQKNIMTALKHFPPLAAGAAPGDVEAAAADPLNILRELIESGDADLVMTSHLPPAGETGETVLPASLTAGLVRKRLRDELGFDGVVLSSDLQAAEIAGRWGLEERVMRAVAAGNDILLAGIDAPPSPDLAVVMAAAIANAVTRGDIARETLEASHARIAKLKAGLVGGGNAIASAEGKGAQKPAAR